MKHQLFDSKHDDSRLYRRYAEMVRRYVRSQLGATAVMKTGREMAIKALAKYPGQIKDHDVLVKSYDATAPADRISRLILTV